MALRTKQKARTSSNSPSVPESILKWQFDTIVLDILCLFSILSRVKILRVSNISFNNKMKAMIERKNTEMGLRMSFHETLLFFGLL
jgi:hypothetical protein